MLETVADPCVSSARFGTPSDHQLVAAVRRGDDRAFEQLYSRYHRRIAAYVYGMVKDYGRAEDVTQEVFVAALRRMRETERPIAFKPWVYEIAKNACIDAFRRSRRTEEISYDADEGLAPADYGRLVGTGPSPLQAFEVKQELHHLRGAFGGLSETHHDILVMRELEGLSYREIGEKMGLTRPAVESTLFRARKRLSEEYDELISGQRCRRIQAIIATAGSGSVGVRDSRRLARHVSHCQPCRRLAAAAGLDTGTLAPRRRDRVAAKVAGWLPFPFLWRGRRGTGADVAAAQLASSGDPAVWAKAVVAAATVLVAALAGVGGHGAPAPDAATPGAGGSKARSAAGAKASGSHPAALRRGTSARRDARAGTGGAGTGGARAGGSARRAGQGQTGDARGGSGSGTTPGAGAGAAPGAAPAGSSPEAAEPSQIELPSTAPVSRAGGRTTPRIALPTDSGEPPTRTAGDTVRRATEPVKDALTPVTEALNPVTEAAQPGTDAASPVTEATAPVTQPVTDAVGGATGGAPLP